MLFSFLGPLSLSSAVKETKVGTASIISVVCQQCDKENTIVTSGQHQYGKQGPKPYDIYTRIALGAIDNGIGYTHVNGFLSTLNVPTISKTAYKNREREVGKAIEELATNSYQMVSEEEIYQAENNGKIRGEHGLMPLSVSYDVQWLKGGRANNSLNRQGAMMGTHTKKVLDFASANKFCRICEASKSKGNEPGCHDCRINHTGSSKSMAGSSSRSETFSKTTQSWSKVYRFYWG